MDALNESKIRFEKNGEVTVATFLCSEISTLEDIEDYLDEFKTRIKKDDIKLLIIDMSGVQFVATTAINLLLVVLKHMRMKGGDVCLCGLTEKVRQVFGLMQLSKLFNIYLTRDDALKAIGN